MAESELMFRVALFVVLPAVEEINDGGVRTRASAKFWRSAPGCDAEVIAEASDFLGVSDEGFYLHQITALGAYQRINFKDSLHTGGPGFGWFGLLFFVVTEWRHGYGGVLVGIFG